MKIPSLLEDKRGGYTDIFIWMIMTFVIILMSAMFIYMGSEIEDSLHENLDNKTHDNVNYTKTIDDSMGELNNSLSILYWVSIFIIFGMIISIFIGSYMVQTKPIFFVPYIFIIFIAIIISVPISNAYDTLRTTTDLSATLNNFVGANFILLYLPIWVSIISIVGGIIMFAKMKMGENTVYG